MLLKGAIAAEGKVGLMMNVKKDDLKKVLEALPALKKPTISELSDKEWIAINTIVDEKIVREIIPKLKKAGAIIIGKTNLDAWGHGSSGENSDFGSIKNPYDLKLVPGGSSSGSAVSIATGEALVSTGTDTGSSVRLPASFCGVVGLKPTYGRVSRYGIIAMASSLDSVGHFTGDVSDSAYILKITAGKDLMDATTSSRPVPDYLKNTSKKIKIGLPKEYFGKGVDARISDKIHKIVKDYPHRIVVIDNHLNFKGLLKDIGLCITALGVSLYEFNYFGIPVVLLCNYKKDKKDARILERLHIAVSLGYYRDTNLSEISRRINKILAQYAAIDHLSGHAKWVHLSIADWDKRGINQPGPG